MVDIKQTHTLSEYVEYATTLDESMAHVDFTDWVNENVVDLKATFVTCLANNTDPALYLSFMEWSMEKWVIHNYNKLKAEIEILMGDASV